MNTNDYQVSVAAKAVNKATFENMEYLACGLIGETGELAEEVKKMLRDDGGLFTVDRRNAIRIEAGDVLWYLSAIATRCGLFLSAITGYDSFPSAPEQSWSRYAGPGRIRCLAVAVSDAANLPDEGTIHDAFLRLVDVCDWADVSFESVAAANLAKIDGRLARGTIGGSGDR